jgi:hypothetical protein
MPRLELHLTTRTAREKAATVGSVSFGLLIALVAKGCANEPSDLRGGRYPRTW